jgi:hypothetical protein
MRHVVGMPRKLYIQRRDIEKRSEMFEAQEGWAWPRIYKLFGAHLSEPWPQTISLEDAWDDRSELRMTSAVSY